MDVFLRLSERASVPDVPREYGRKLKSDAVILS
jgi:hypothetical protein